eukprot:jgi/Picsp_1/2025/NSC_05491-R1_protein
MSSALKPSYDTQQQISLSVVRLQPPGLHVFSDQCKFDLAQDSGISGGIGSEHVVNETSVTEKVLGVNDSGRGGKVEEEGVGTPGAGDPTRSQVENNDKAGTSETRIFSSRIEHDIETAGVTGYLTQSTKSFGYVYIGQTLRMLVSIRNIQASRQPILLLAVKIELQHDRGKVILYESNSNAKLNSGEGHSIVVNHDLTEMGSHTLVCSCQYVEQYGETKYCPKAFKFVAENPLIVKTKHRYVGRDPYLEATIENKSKGTMLLDCVEIIPSSKYRVEELNMQQDDDLENRAIDAVSDSKRLLTSEQKMERLADYAASIPLIEPGESMAFVYKFTVANTEDFMPVMNPNEPLGKMDIRWRGPYGDPGHLQTQAIIVPAMTNSPQKIDIKWLPKRLAVGKIFKVLFSVRNYTVDLVGPFLFQFVGTDDNASSIKMDGQHSKLIHQIDAHGSIEIEANFISLECGRQSIRGIVLVNERDGAVVDRLPPIEVFIH